MLVRARTNARAALCVLLLSVAPGVHARTADEAYFALIRAERFADAYALGERELAAHPGAGTVRCAILDRIARVQVFDYHAPDVDRQRRVLEAARGCHASDGAREDARAAWLTLRLDSIAAAHGQYAKIEDEARKAEAVIDAHGASLRREDLAGAYHALGGIALNHGDYAIAARDYQRAVVAAGGADAAARAVRSVVQAPLPSMLERIGRYADAVDAGRLALRWAEESFGEHSLAATAALGTLAQTEFFAGRYADALEHAARGVREARAQGPRGTRGLAFVLVTYGNALRETGELARARDALAEALALERAATAPVVGTLASRLNQLGYVEQLLRGCDVALPHYREALALGERQFGADNVRIAVALTNIAGCEIELGHYDEAQRGFERERGIIVRAYGDHHPAVAKSLFNLADVALERGDDAVAQALLRDGLASMPADADALATNGVAAHRALARALLGLGRDEEAFAEAVVAETGRQRLLRKVGVHLGEANALAFKDHLAGAMDLVLALAARHPSQANIATAWSLQAGARQLVTTLVATRLAALRQRADAASEAAWRTWEDASRAYGDAAIAREGGKLEADRLRERADALDEAERALARRIGIDAHASSPVPLDVDRLREGLPADAALVAYAIADPRLPHDAHPARARQLYAFVLRHADAPRIVDLGPADAATAAIHDWTVLLRDARSSESDVLALGTNVVQRIYDPLGLPDATRRVFAVPDGEVHRLAWYALPGWIERGRVVQLLGNERELTETPPGAVNPPRLMLVGAPAGTPRDAVLGGCAADGALPGATREIERLRTEWRSLRATAPIDAYEGRFATEAAVRRNAGASSLLHFATHAFSGSSTCLARGLLARGVQLTGNPSSSTASSLSGLVLQPMPGVGHDDGIFTAAEVATLKLDGVENVTLAACDSGLGPVSRDEGVFGLARAFRVAGARNVVVSLWQVDDSATSGLMRHFYRELLATPTGVPDALAAAARAARADRLASSGASHPYYWAAFVSTGGAR
ncbi:tetratricopeptide (TPR) repeat protein [Dokdonella fugitiva]|uniref:Tetratricopeptide (TPR) repeat protein n=1 Tax=Dokdonella fugitiva TaxID=328517 RepID=A0A839F4D2_9GAMM|nr:CHAT domain-containing tetratricopeptide repeat protein [Dokdonella fugitiva]MBA8887061.1 tetratricopeptide (TPR) repeat protein [Dokdonella fugitiva]